MVDIISRRDGPRREDVQPRHLIQQNRQTITRLADRLSGGGYSAGKAARVASEKALAAAPSAEPCRIQRVDSGSVRVRVSVNNRVVAYDSGSGRQRHLLGEIRRQDGQRYFALATTTNGFLSALPPEVLDPIEELDGQIIDAACPEALLADEIAERLGWH